MKRIVLFNNSLSGGAGKSIITLCEELSKHSVEVHLIIYENRIHYNIPSNISFHMLESNGSKREIASALSKKLNELGKIDFIMSNSSPSNVILSRLDLPQAWHCIRSAETKQFSGIWKPVRSFWRKRKYKKLYDGKRLITVSQGLERVVKETYAANPLELKTIYNPFDFRKIELLSRETDVDIPPEPYIIHMGRFDLTSKRQDVLLEAYKISKIDYPLVLLGEGRDREEIESLIRKMGLKDKVFLPGFRSNPYPWLRHAKLFVFSSDFEGFPRALVEALSLGTPVVSTDCPSGPSEILKEEFSSFLVPTGDYNALSDAINRAMISYPIISKKLLEPYRRDHIVKEYLELIDVEYNH